MDEKIKIKHDDFRSLNRFDHEFSLFLIISKAKTTAQYRFRHLIANN